MKISINLINNLGQSFSSARGKCLRQCGSRIFSDNRMTVEKIQVGHLEETLKRIKKEGDTPTSLFSYIETLAIQANRQVEISRENRKETIDLVVSYDNINILPSKSSKSKPESVRMGVVYARELEERKDTKGKVKDAIKWVLLVDKHIEDIQTAIKYLDYYTQHWKIERFHYTLKQGMKIEKLQFVDAKTLSNVIAFYSVLAWFTQWITYIGRVKPNMPAKEVTDELSIEVLTAFMKKKISSAKEVMMAIGVLGGFIGGSKRYPYPGLKSMWQGITKLFFLKQGWLLAKSQLSDIYAT